jgi:hypothetical protein
VTDGINAAVQPMKPSVADAPRDRVVIESARSELVDRYHAVALGRDASHAVVGGWFVLLTSDVSRTNHAPGHTGIVPRIV